MKLEKIIYNMAHDIRTPLNAIIGYATIAKKNVNNEDKLMDYLNKIEKSGKELSALLVQILEMSRLEMIKEENE